MTFEEIIAQMKEAVDGIRKAIYGVQVREYIAKAMENVVEVGKQVITSAKVAKTSEENAKKSETNAKSSETNAKKSETNAKSSETNAKASETAAKTSETNAKTSEENAKHSADRAAAIVGTDKTLTMDGAAADAAAVGGIVLPRVVVQTEAGSSIVLSDGEKSVSGVAADGSFSAALPHDGEWTVTATLGSDAATETVQAEYCRTKTLTLIYAHIYGASWDGTSTTKWSRTDEAAEFTDPVPYIDGSSSYGSPFDSLQPWAGMTVSERTGGTMVSIPKFWYKLTQNGSGMSIQIADRAVEGYSVSPAHIDRGDGHGERDVVYVGRYHCASDYKSKTGSFPLTSRPRSSNRSDIHNLGSTIWQSDFAMRFTIWLLYIVEFCDWNSQDAIGYGCGNNSSKESMGYTDSMPYHTGTIQSHHAVYGCGTQYRNIEGLWDNVFDWCDGCYYNSNGLYIILNPSKFSDSSGGTAVGVPSTGYPSAFTVKTTGGFSLFIPTTEGGSGSTYSCDYWYFGSSTPCLYVGGDFNEEPHFGMFTVICISDSIGSTNIGCRLQELPNG